VCWFIADVVMNGAYPPPLIAPLPHRPNPALPPQITLRWSCMRVCVCALASISQARRQAFAKAKAAAAELSAAHVSVCLSEVPGEEETGREWLWWALTVCGSWYLSLARLHLLKLRPRRQRRLWMRVSPVGVSVGVYHHHVHLTCTFLPSPSVHSGCAWPCAFVDIRRPLL
jgi:hypothetical protein